MSNYPPGVTGMEDYFNPPVCPNCEDEFDGEKCECGYEYEEYDPLHDHGDEAFERAGDR